VYKWLFKNDSSRLSSRYESVLRRMINGSIVIITQNVLLAIK